MKKINKSNVEYAVLSQPYNIIENRSGVDEAIVNDNELEYIRSHWQDKIKKHTPFINTEKDKERLKLEVENGKSS